VGRRVGRTFLLVDGRAGSSCMVDRGIGRVLSVRDFRTWASVPPVIACYSKAMFRHDERQNLVQLALGELGPGAAVVQDLDIDVDLLWLRMLVVRHLEGWQAAVVLVMVASQLWRVVRMGPVRDGNGRAMVHVLGTFSMRDQGSCRGVMYLRFIGAELMTRLMLIIRGRHFMVELAMIIRGRYFMTW